MRNLIQHHRWIPIEYYMSKKYGQEVRIRLRDGSELEGAILQSDGTWWWRDRYFDLIDVTHIKEQNGKAI